MALDVVDLSELSIEDERSFRHVGLYADLKEVLLRTRHPFAVPRDPDRSLDWDRATFLNLTFYDALRPLDVLEDRSIPADVVAHVGWHVAAQHAHTRGAPGEPARAETALLAESVASGFDIYLVGRLLGHAPDSAFVESQVPAMRESAVAAGCDDARFEALLESTAADPEAAFEDLRGVLFDAATSLIGCEGPVAAEERLSALRARRFYPLLHHFELSNWILSARTMPPRDDAARRLHETLSASGRGSLEHLERAWIAPLLC